MLRRVGERGKGRGLWLRSENEETKDDEQWRLLIREEDPRWS
jgi:hypothetical protein